MTVNNWIGLLLVIVVSLLGLRDMLMRVLADRADARVKRVAETDERLATIDALLSEQSKAIASLSKKVNERIAERIRR